jgi:hypothetical protein
MHRPTRKHRHLQTKVQDKVTHSRKSGKKAKRWKKWMETYASLNKDAGSAK